VREEYRRLGGQAERERSGAAAAGLGSLARQLAPLLSQLATMEALAQGGREVRVGDILKLFGKVEGVLGEAGLERIGRVGEQAPFDTRLHQTYRIIRKRESMSKCQLEKLTRGANPSSDNAAPASLRSDCRADVFSGSTALR